MVGFNNLPPLNISNPSSSGVSSPVQTTTGPFFSKPENQFSPPSDTLGGGASVQAVFSGFALPLATVAALGLLLVFRK